MEITQKLLKTVFTYNQLTGEILHDKKPREMFKSDSAFKSVNSRLYGKLALSKRKGGALHCFVGNKALRAVSVVLAHMNIKEEEVARVRYIDGDKGNLIWENLDIQLRLTERRGDLSKIEYDSNITTVEVNASASFSSRYEAELAKRQIDSLLKSFRFRYNGSRHND